MVSITYPSKVTNFCEETSKKELLIYSTVNKSHIIVPVYPIAFCLLFFTYLSCDGGLNDILMIIYRQNGGPGKQNQYICRKQQKNKIALLLH